MADETYLEPNRTAQLILSLMLILVALLLAAFEPVIDRMTPGQGASLAELQGAAQVMVWLALGTFAVTSVLALFWIVYFARLGYRALRVGSFPPPGTIVFLRTRVRTGGRAVLSGYLSISCAALMAVLLVLLCSVTWRLTSAL